jgi:hypothetical protein
VFVPFVKGLIRTAVVATTVAGCASQTVAVHGAPEQVPLAQRHDARVLVHYVPAVRDAQYSDEIVNVAIGATSIERLDQAFAALFSSATQAPEWPPWRSEPLAVDGVIEVDQGSVDVETGVSKAPLPLGPFNLGTPDKVIVYYHACLYRPDGAKVSCWEAESLVERQRGFLATMDASVAWLADQAMTDAVAKLMRAIETDPAVQAWMAQPTASDRAVSVVSRIAVLGWPLSAGYGEEGEVAGCLMQSIGKELTGIEFVGRSRVRAALYPLLQASTEPRTEEEFARLLDRVDVQSRLRGLGIRYLVAFMGGTNFGPVKGLPICGYTGCLGYVWMSEESRLDAVLWDLATSPTARSTAATAQGTTAVPIFLVPVVLPAHSLAEACEQLGRNIADAIKAPLVVQPRAVPQEAPAAPAADSPRVP